MLVGQNGMSILIVVVGIEVGCVASIAVRQLVAFPSLYSTLSVSASPVSPVDAALQASRK